MTKGKKVQKKINHNKVEDIHEENNSIFRTLTVILVVLCFLGLFYLLAIHITNKNSDSSDSSSTSESSSDSSTSIDYGTILLGSSFNKGDGEYLVVYYDSSDDDISSSITSAISNYKSNDDHLRIYNVDMSSAMNKSHVTTDETNKNPANTSELYINGPTVIKFNNGSVVDYIEGLDSIVSYLG